MNQNYYQNQSHNAMEGHSPEDSLNNRGTLKASLVAMRGNRRGDEDHDSIVIIKEVGRCPQSLCLSVCMKGVRGALATAWQGAGMF